MTSMKIVTCTIVLVQPCLSRSSPSRDGARLHAMSAPPTAVHGNEEKRCPGRVQEGTGNRRLFIAEVLSTGTTGHIKVLRETDDEQ